MAFPTPNTTFRFWESGHDPATAPEDFTGVLQQLKPLITLNEFQQATYENGLIYRFALVINSGMVGHVLDLGQIGIPAFTSGEAIYLIRALQFVNQPVSEARYVYCVCVFQGYIP